MACRLRLPTALLVLGLTACSGSASTSTATTKPNERAGSTVAATTDTGAPSSTATQTPPTASTAPDTSPSPPDTEAELTAAVREFWNLYLAVGSATEPFDAEAARARLGARSTGESLNRLVAYFSSNAASGYVVRGNMDLSPVVVSIDGGSAQVRDCYDDTTGLYRPDGSRVDADNPLRHQVLMTLVLEGGVWKVSAISDEGDGCEPQ